MGGTLSAENPYVEAYINNRLTQETITSLSRQRNSNINGTGRRGETVLTLATKAGDLPTIRLLKANNANLVIPASKMLYKRQPLHLALALYHEPVALYLFTQSQFVRGIVHTRDGLNKTALKIAAQKDMFYMLWVMLVHAHCFSEPLLYSTSTNQWQKLNYSVYIENVRQALDESNDVHGRFALLFASFGLPCSVVVSADRGGMGNFPYNPKNTQNLAGLWPHHLKYQDPINFTLPPQLSASLASPHDCRYCTSAKNNTGTAMCIDNNCTMLCYLAHFHQFTTYLQQIYNSQQFSLSPQDLGHLIMTELNKFIMLTNQHEENDILEIFNLKPAPVVGGPTPEVCFDGELYVATRYGMDAGLGRYPPPTSDGNNAKIPLILPLLTPPPVLLSAALQQSYLCSRTHCFCDHRATGSAQTSGCFIYPPLLSIPTFPLHSLTTGYHTSDCTLVPLDRALKTESINNFVQSIRESKSLHYATDCINLHTKFVSKVEKIFPPPRVVPVPQSTPSQAQQVQHLQSQLDKLQLRKLSGINSPGFLSPHDYTLLRYHDSITAPVLRRPKNISERAKGFFSGIKDLAANAGTLIGGTKLHDGSSAKVLDDIETVAMNNIRYYTNKLVADSRFTPMICGPKRDFITPMRLTEQPVHTAFTPLYPPTATESRFYDFPPPILDVSYSILYGTNAIPVETSKEKVKVSNVVDKFFQYKRENTRPYANQTPYPTILDPMSQKAADLTQSHAPTLANPGMSANPLPEAHNQEHYQQTCLCGAHSTTIQPIPLADTRVNLNYDGRSLRITSGDESENYRNNRSTNPLSSVLYSALTPTTSIIYEPNPKYNHLNRESQYDYGFPILHLAFKNITPLINQTHDLSNSSTNFNSHLAAENLSAAVSTSAKNPVLLTNTGKLPPSASMEGSGSRHGGVNDEHDLGSVIISPTHHVSIRVPVHLKTAVYFTSALHRVMQAKFPHYLLYSQWLRFTTRIANAVSRLAQRRMMARITATEISVLSIYLRDFKALTQLFRENSQPYNIASLSQQKSSVTPQARVHIDKYTQQLFQLYEEYEILLEKYLLLRKYRLSTSQFTSNNTVGILGGVVSTAEHDVELYHIINGTAPKGTNQYQRGPHDTAQNEKPTDKPASFTSPAAIVHQTSVLKNDIRIDYIERLLLHNNHVGSNILTSTAIPAPPPGSPPGTVPAGSITLELYSTSLQHTTRQLQTDFHTQLKEFHKFYPKFIKDPSGTSILSELDKYYTHTCANSNITTTTTNQPNPDMPPLSAHPFSIIENTMLDAFLTVVPKVIRGFVQRFQAAIGTIQSVQNDPNTTNPHNINYPQSIYLLNTLITQANMLDKWLCLPETIPSHFHTAFHIPIPKKIVIEQRPTPIIPDDGLSFQSASVSPNTIPHTPALQPTYQQQSSTPVPILIPATPVGSNTNIYTPHHYQPTPQVQPQQPPQQTIYTFQQPSQQQSLPVYQEKPLYDSLNAPPPTYEEDMLQFADSGASSPLSPNTLMMRSPNAGTNAFYAGDNMYDYTTDNAPPPSYDFVDLPDTSQVKFRYNDPSQAPVETPVSKPAVSVRPASVNPYNNEDEFHIEAFFNDPDTVPSKAKVNNNPVRKGSSVESGPYFFNLIKEDPRIVLALDEGYVEVFENNPEILVYLRQNAPDVFKKLIENMPRLRALAGEPSNLVMQ